VNKVEPGVSAECETSFPPNDPIFAGHFPGDPLVPGVILTEALAQTAGIAAASGHAEESPRRFLLSAIRQMKFFGPVRPDQTITLRAQKLAEIGGLLQFKVQATVDRQQVAEGELVLSKTKANH